MNIDCDSCAVKDLACGDCVVTLLLSLSPVDGELTEAEVGALALMADSGLVPRLRLVAAPKETPVESQKPIRTAG